MLKTLVVVEDVAALRLPAKPCLQQCFGRQLPGPSVLLFDCTYRVEVGEYRDIRRCITSVDTSMCCLWCLLWCKGLADAPLCPLLGVHGGKSSNSVNILVRCFQNKTSRISPFTQLA